MEQKIKERLQDNLSQNISVLGFMENYPVEGIYQEGDSFIILGQSDQLWAYIVSNSKQELINLLDKYQYKTNYFASVERWMKPIICKGKEVEWDLMTDRYLLSRETKIQLPRRMARRLEEEQAEYLYEKSAYRQFTSIDYIKERIGRGVSAGIYENGKLVAWGLTHDDGALGFLYVLPEYRKRIL